MHLPWNMVYCSKQNRQEADDMAEEAPGYQCPKCGCKSCEQDQFQATGGDVARVFNV